MTAREEFGYVAADGSCWQVVGGCVPGSGPFTATDGNWFIGGLRKDELLDDIESVCLCRPQRKCDDCGAPTRGLRYCNTRCEARDHGY